MLYEVMLSNKHWRIVSSSVADAQTSPLVGAGWVTCLGITYVLVLVFPLTLLKFNLLHCLYLSSHGFSCFCSFYSLPTQLGRVNTPPLYRQCPSDSRLCPILSRCTCTAVLQCATSLYRSPAPPLVLLELVSVLALLLPHPKG